MKSKIIEGVAAERRGVFPRAPGYGSGYLLISQEQSSNETGERGLRNSLPITKTIANNDVLASSILSDEVLNIPSSKCK